MTKQNQTILTVVLLIVVAGAGFFAGTKYQQSQARATFTGQFGANGGARGMMGAQGRNGAPRGSQVVGTILSADANTITVQLADGSSKIVLLSSTTSINKASEGTKADLAVGTKVGVFGATNADGSVSAQNIQINPIIRGLSGTPAPTK